MELGLLPVMRLRVYAQAGATAGGPIEAQAATETATPIAAVDITKLFAEIDKFTSHIRSMPAAANNPDIKKRLESVEAGKEQIRSAHAADLARRTAVFGQLAAF